MIIYKVLLLFLALFSINVTHLNGETHGDNHTNKYSDDKPNQVAQTYFSKNSYIKFFEHTQERLPEWKPLFKKYSKKYDIPWTLIAAVAYQESKWDQSATSHTGVKGIMQLTLSTADYLGINNRENPHESIQGGAYYLKYLFSKTSKKLSNYERWTQALAAYNIGWAHLSDAKLLTIELDKNPFKWSDLRQILPLLEDEIYYSKLRFGTARGKETVQFVDHVIAYHKLLTKTFTQQLLTSRDF